MKKLLLPILAMTTLCVTAQVPATPLAQYEFTNGSLENSINNSYADFTGSAITSVDDRYASVGDAAQIPTNYLTGFTTGTGNIHNSTLSFWMKHAPFTGVDERILELKNSQADGLLLWFDGDSLTLLGQATGGQAADQIHAKIPANIDNNQWHHVVITSGWGANSNEVKLEVFIDAVNIAFVGPTTIQPYPNLVSFIKNATLILGGASNYSGDIDDIYYYNRVLSQVEITQLMNHNPNPASRYYVDVNATGNNTGASWIDAFVDLDDALNALGKGTEVWVADGTYIPQSVNRQVGFSWDEDSVKLYGGFAGGETMLSQRDWMANRTVLSGDIGSVGAIHDNLYSVFIGPYGSATNLINYGLLDGFVIEDGNANFNGGHSFGSVGAAVYSGYYINKMDFHNCEFSNNTGKYGAFYSFAEFNHVEVNIDACIFKNNSGRVGSAILAESKSKNMNLNVTNTLFFGNESKDMGSMGNGLGAVVYLETKNTSNTNMTAKFINSTFANNPNNGTHSSNFESTIVYYDAASSGGVKNVEIDNCIFWGNTGDSFSIKKNPGGSDFTSVSIHNTISEFATFPTSATTANIITTVPMFTDESNDDFTLQSNSPAVNSGSQAGLTIPSFDLAGNSRVFSSEIDLGCYESSHTGGSTGGGGVGINEANSIFELTAYPNPTTGRVTFSTMGTLTSLDDRIKSIVIYNLTGQKVATFNNVKTINISSLSKGIYTAQVIVGSSKPTMHKLVKE